MDPRDVLEHAYNGADPREFLARSQFPLSPDAPYEPIAWSTVRSANNEVEET
jgi:hypothetical protein